MSRTVRGFIIFLGSVGIIAGDEDELLHSRRGLRCGCVCGDYIADLGEEVEGLGWVVELCDYGMRWVLLGIATRGRGDERTEECGEGAIRR
ncbi:hypothetical protein B0H67DRAFT_572058 [Lasiosphaeris hirsuta]|uniref:Uncharacterized protein n=1 Tax=Lasiosphaeris hirsuta TaxID=260670 RepID=A0AA40E857_9PEZI|nr:hypothetical protein B0H67DRAFT_572058 [Lasiosphaeris hirsuta]